MTSEAPSSGSIAPADQDEPLVPPRGWWRKRLLIALGAVLLLTPAVWFCWAWEADRRLSAVIAARRAAGWPIRPEEFEHEPVPDEENAAGCLRGTFPQLKIPPGQPTESDLAGNEPALAALRRARSLPHVDWQANVRVPWTPNPDLGPLRSLGRLGALRVERSVRDGDHLEAVETLRDMLALSSAVGDAPGTIELLTSWALGGLSTSAIERVAPHLQITEAAASSVVACPARREDVELLIDALLDEDQVRSAWSRAMHMEYATAVNTLECLDDGRITLGSLMPGGGCVYSSTLDPLVCTLVGPLWKLDIANQAEDYDALLRAGSARSLPVAVALCPAQDDPDGLTLPLPDLWVTPPFHLLDPLFRFVARNRMAACDLGIRLYELDHGARPTQLEQLVPEYLPEVPKDSFAAETRPIGYLPHASPPLLYSVGLDGADDGGRFVVQNGAVHWRNSPDLVWFLNGDRPRPLRFGRSSASAPTSAPSTQQADQHEAAGAQAGEDQRDTDDRQK